MWRPPQSRKEGTIAKQPSRPKRWAAACSRARDAYDELEGAFSDLKELQEEYQGWQDNLPENLQQSALYEKLDAISNLDFDIESIDSVVSEAEMAELPQGFGRD